MFLVTRAKRSDLVMDRVTNPGLLYQKDFHQRNIHDGKEDGFVILKESTAPHKPLLRIVKKGVITYEKNGEVVFHTWKEIERIHYNKKFPLYKGLINWFLNMTPFKKHKES